jgi:hypothetical protein
MGTAGEDDFEMVAASLRADAGDLVAFVEALAVKLEQALPQRTRVRRRASGLFSKRGRVEQIEVTVGEDDYLLGCQRGAVETRRASTVRGIVLKSEPVALDQWIEGLARAIAAEARSSEQGRRALERLLGARPGQ